MKAFRLLLRSRPHLVHQQWRRLHTSPRFLLVKPFLLADIGEGITECQLIQWFVEPGARVEQFDKLCEVQSDKASVEITSPFDGVIKKLYYDPDDMAKTGKPLVDIDIEGEVSEADLEKLGDTGKEEATEEPAEAEGQGEQDTEQAEKSAPAEHNSEDIQHDESAHRQVQRSSVGDTRSLATPAVRRLIKEHGLDITDVRGTGKDGRVLKEDVERHVSQGAQQQTQAPISAPVLTGEDRKVPLTTVQSQMFKVMTRSLNIPHFLYSSSADMTAVTSLRKKLNTSGPPEQKLTHLAFIMKAVSLAFLRHPLLNSSLDTRDLNKPELTQRAQHNFGIAVDAPAGLVVPVVRNVQQLSIAEIAAEMRRLSGAARNNKLAPKDFQSATFTVSNIGSVGGGVVAPVISEPQVAIVGVGRSKIVPAFDENDELIKREELVLSWSADHRVVDGAECARCAEHVRRLLEEPAIMLTELR